MKSLSNDDVLLFGHLYRRVTSALSTARSQDINDSHIEYLNQLAARSYGYIYVAETKGWPSIPNFFKNEFPQSFRRNLLFIMIAFFITIAGGLFAFGVVRHDLGKADVVLGPGAGEHLGSISDRHTGHKNWMPEEERPIMSSMIMQNNIRVAAVAFATGILAGIGTFLMLFYNGLMLGVVGALIAAHGGEVQMGFWSFVAPHGVIELTAIFVAGGAGLMLGWAVLNPGEYSRRDAVKLAGREATKLMIGVAAMLVVAGVIEGFFSPSMTPDRVKLIVAAMIGTSEYYYLFMSGRGSEKKTDHAASKYADSL